MKILLVAINAKYIHSNLAVYSLRACSGEPVEIAEYTINHYKEDILADIYKRSPDVLAFSCYIWNLSYVRDLIRDFHLIRPEVPVWVGGPEVSYDGEDFLRECPEVTGVMSGEGERMFSALASFYASGQGSLEEIRGIIYREEQNGKIKVNSPAELMNLDEIPFVYENMKDFQNKIIYYESSRGCPFSCSYCLSSIDKSLRLRCLDLVFKELQFFLDQKVPQVKFVDRTFNCSHPHAQAIWKYIGDHDNGITNFHFEIAADLLNEEELKLLSRLRPGLVQLEIGVQSVNPDTIREIDRVMNLVKLKENVSRVHAGKNIHQHLDLIAGLPHEDYDSFVHSFNEVYGMRPQQLQLGFLKVLKGSKMYRRAADYGIIYGARPPYEVLFSNWLSYGEIRKLKAVEVMVEVYYNSCQFTNTLARLEKAFEHPFSMYEKMACFYEKWGLNGRNHSRLARFDILRDFSMEEDAENITVYEELLVLDLYLRENSKSRPGWANHGKDYKEVFQEFYIKEAEAPERLRAYEGYSFKQMMNMTHREVFNQDVLAEGGDGPWPVVFDYRSRDPLTGNAGVILLAKC